MPTFLELISPEAMRGKLAEIIAADPVTRVQSFLLGQDRMLQWAHTLGPTAHAALRASLSPVPPAELRRIDGAPEEPIYLWNSLGDITTFFAIYQRLGNMPLDRPARVLDFGSGSGRLARFANMHEAIEPFAVDANPLLVEWCQLNLARTVTLLQAGRQRLPFNDGMFDLIYAPALFTGAAHDRTQQWFDEVTRVLAPGGLLLAVTYGSVALHAIRGSAVHQATFRITPPRATELIEALAAEGRIYVPAEQDGDGFTFIHPDYPVANWNPEAFEVLQHIPGGLRALQDIVVLQRRIPEDAVE